MVNGANETNKAKKNNACHKMLRFVILRLATETIRTSYVIF